MTSPPTDPHLGLSPLEEAVGSVLGLVAHPEPIGPSPVGVTARAALESVVGSALRRPPCVVSFSGGRDSSAILAIATEVARRDGLALPVPVSLEFPQCAESDEVEWQELVVRHLKLPEWERRRFTHEMDLVGPIAAPSLRRHGLQWPFNAFFHVPIMQVASGGSVLTGIGGDELLSSGWAWHRENQVLSGRARVRPLDPVRALVALGPTRLRRVVLRRRSRRRPAQPMAWLRPEAGRAAEDSLVDVAARESLSFRRSLAESMWPRRSRIIGAHSLDVLAADHDVVCTSPLFAPSVLAAVSRERGWRMFENRTQAMDELVADLLPVRLRARRTKASFNSAFFNRHSRAFAATWDGTGVDDALVDAEVLRRMWTDPGEQPDARTFTLLQSLWLRGQPAAA